MERGGKNESFEAGGKRRGRVHGRDPRWSLTLLHFYFRWSQEGPVFLLFLPLGVCLEVSPTVHTPISTLLRANEVWGEESSDQEEGPEPARPATLLLHGPGQPHNEVPQQVE